VELAEAGGREAPDVVQAARRLVVGGAGRVGWVDGMGRLGTCRGGRDLSRTACVGLE
jgi:hypothetical protein